jgi:hypothetical protein
MAINYQHLQLPYPPKFTQIGIFGLKICHLATLSVAGIAKQIKKKTKLGKKPKIGFGWLALPSE